MFLKKIFWELVWCVLNHTLIFIGNSTTAVQNKAENWSPAGIYNTSYPSRLPLRDFSYDFTDKIL